MDFKVGSFAMPAATGNQTVAHGLSAAPTALILYSADAYEGTFVSSYFFCIGATDGTTSKSICASANDAASSPSARARAASTVFTLVHPTSSALLAEATFVSWDATNFVINWSSVSGEARIVHFVAMSGVSAKLIQWNRPTSTGNKSVTGTGFTPDFVLHFSCNPSTVPETGGAGAVVLGAMEKYGNQWSLSNWLLEADPSDTQRGQRTNRCLFDINEDLSVNYQAAYVSMDADGFTVSFSTVGTARPIFSLCLAGVNVQCGSFNKATGAAPVSQAVTGVGLTTTKRGLFLAGFQRTSSTTAQAEARLGFGVADGTNEGSVVTQSEDAKGTSNSAAISKTTKVFMDIDTAEAITAEADLSSLDSGGFTLNWTTNYATATEILYILLADKASGRSTGAVVG